jgi:CRISPR-associated protein Csh1
MIREIVNFTKNLDEEFKNLEVKAKEGLHINMKIAEIDGVWQLDLNEITYELYNKKMTEESDFIQKCKFLSKYAWYVESNKAFDKGIHTASPYAVAFKREFLDGGGINVSDREKNKREIPDRFRNKYFTNALKLLNDENEILKITAFQDFFVHLDFIDVLKNIDDNLKYKVEEIEDKILILKDKIQKENDKGIKERFKTQLDEITKELSKYKNDLDYVIFYLDEPIEKYIETNSRYLSDKLFNTNNYNTPPNDEGKIFGTSNFMNGFNSSMPFLTHQTASFDITGRISDDDAKYLYEFEQILSRKILPNPLPLFIMQDELQEKVISLFKESGFKLGYKDLIENLWVTHHQDLGNYYLLNWQNSTKGLIFQDFDFVSQFEYACNFQIENLFEIQDKGGKSYVHYPKITNVFQLEQVVFKSLIQSKYLKVDYFGELKKDDYEGLSNTFLCFSKYRKAVYDYVYKSKRQGINEHIFYDMVFSHIKDDLKQNNGYSIKEKLNIYYSLYETFNIHNKKSEISMASQLKKYQEFVVQLSMGKVDTNNTTDKEFAFAAGQVIDYLMGKSLAQDKSYILLEPYLQQAKCQEFKRAIANDIARYKHAIKDNETRFKSVCDFVLTYDTDVNMKELMPEILAGAFSKCQFFHKDLDKSQEIN